MICVRSHDLFAFGARDMVSIGLRARRGREERDAGNHGCREPAEAGVAGRAGEALGGMATPRAPSSSAPSGTRRWSGSRSRRRPASTSSPTASSSGSISSTAFSRRSKASTGPRKTKMGIRDNRYVVDVPTVTAPVRRRGSIHGDEARFTRAYTGRKLKFTLPGPMTICDTIADAHYGRRADMAMAFAARPERGGARARGGRRRRHPVRRAGLQRVHGRRQGVGHRRSAPGDRRPEVHDRGAHLLRLRHRGQHPLEADARRGVAPVRGDLSGAERQPDRAGLAGMRQFARADRRCSGCSRTRTSCSAPSTSPRSRSRRPSRWPT